MAHVLIDDIGHSYTKSMEYGSCKQNAATGWSSDDSLDANA